MACKSTSGKVLVFFKFTIKLCGRSQQQLQQLQLAVLYPFRLYWLSWGQYSDTTFFKEDFTVHGGETSLSKKCPCVHRKDGGSSTAGKKWCLGSKLSLWGSFYFVFCQAFCVVLIQVRKNVAPCGLNVYICVCEHTQMYRHTNIWIHTQTHAYKYTLAPALQIQPSVLCIINNNCKQKKAEIREAKSQNIL